MQDFKARIGRQATLITLIICISLIGTARAEEGVASFYGNGEKLNKHTANGEIFNPTDMTCATYNYKFNTLLKVVNLENGKSIVVRVNDRGPNKRLHRIIDLSREAFKKISPLKKGIIKVSVEQI
jgi:rare lipoprotein A